MAVTPTPPTTNYGYLSTIKDPSTRRAVKLILDRLGDIELRSGGIGALTKPLTDDLNAAGNQLKSLKDPTNDRDAVTLQFLKSYVQSAITAAAISPQPTPAVPHPPVQTPPIVPAPPGPPPTPPPTAPGTVLILPTDMIDMATTQIVDAPDIHGWAITTVITRIEITPTNTIFTFSKQVDPGSWPDVVPPGFAGPIQYTVWAFIPIAGQWVGSGFIQMWRGRDGVGDAPSDYARNWWYAARWAPMTGHLVTPGSQIAFCVTAGNARDNVGPLPLNERSQLVLITAPVGDVGTFATA